MKTITQKCDYCLREVHKDTLSAHQEELRRLYRIGIKDACMSCHEKAQRLLELSLKAIKQNN